MKKSTHIKEKLKYLTKKGKSEKLGMESLRETLEVLKVRGGQAGREQKKILAASVTSMDYGVPELGLNSREEKEVIEMKKQLISGEQKVLVVPLKATRQVFPPEVHQIAQQHWENITVVEPAKPRRLKTTVRDGDETTPPRYQTMTNDETYQSFKENCSNQVKQIMEKHSEKRMAAIMKRPASQDREYRLQYAQESLPGKFPSPSWWLEQRPKEVKMMQDHTTGLCKVNFYSLFSILKK